MKRPRLAPRWGMGARWPLVIGVGLALAAGQARAGIGDDPFAGISQVEVFANSAMVITPYRSDRFALKIYRLDGIVRAEQMLSQGIPQKQVEAERYFARNGAQLKAKVTPMVMEAATGLRLASYYRIERLPAIVINGRTAVFGTTNVDEAIARYQAMVQARSQGKGGGR